VNASGDGMPIEGASVYVFAPCSPGHFLRTTSRDGTTTITDVPKGCVEVYACADGYFPGTSSPTLNVAGQTFFLNLETRVGLYGSALVSVSFTDGSPSAGAKVTVDGTQVGQTNSFGTLLLEQLNYSSFGHTISVLPDNYPEIHAHFAIGENSPEAFLHFILYDGMTLNVDRLNKVDAKDLLLLTQHLGSNNPLMDFNGDGVVDWKDIFILVGGWNGDGWMAD